jgi:DNA-binding PadR family transcriptional regulator
MALLGRTRRDGVSKLNGPALLKDIEGFADGRLGAGTLYGAIARLEERGLIVALPEDDRRRPYEITAEGVALLAEVIAEVGRIVEVGRARLALLSAGPA